MCCGIVSPAFYLLKPEALSQNIFKSACDGPGDRGAKKSLDATRRSTKDRLRRSHGGSPVTRLPPLLSQRSLADPGLLEPWQPRETIAKAESLADWPGSLSGKQGRQQMAWDRGTSPPPFSCSRRQIVNIYWFAILAWQGVFSFGRGSRCIPDKDAS